jgi:hypothetical protein
VNDNVVYPLAQMFLQKMYKERQSEIGRLYVLFRYNYLTYAQPLYEHHLKHGVLDKYHANTHFKWDDAAASIGYFDYVLRRLGKYSLTRGALQPRKFPNYREELQKEEDKLVEYFLYEMRKAPVEQKEAQLMPVN